MKLTTLRLTVLVLVLPLSLCSQDTSLPLESIDSEKLEEAGIHPLVSAYPEYIEEVKNNTVYFKDGSSLPYDDEKSKSFKEKLQNSDIEDMVNQDYLAATIPPPYYEDPGRFRNDLLLKKIYGKDKKETDDNIVTIAWMPGISKKKIRITKVNGVDKKLKAISDELSALPARYHKYVDNPAGGYVYRNIAGTKRLSAHSFGIAFDINVNQSHYWLWDTKSIDRDPGMYRNEIPQEIVEVFEKHHFIWGGKWYHYDTMHFEYRPELFQK